MQKREPNPIDVHVGVRIRTQRKLRGMTQVQLADQLGITFQQVQKYEKGTNRVGSSRLSRIAEVLGVQIPFFFEGDPSFKGNDFDPLSDADPVFGFVNTKDGLELNKAFVAIKNERVRRSIVKMIETVAKSSQAADPAD
ncbi:helix-turn-helix domain-containing protein [Pararhizobium arenae]|uniref:helix-turn-helix domain-containing protein n=1 Tax=Pararhizobium arenae TaxID=1856850 RepID=UPI00094B7695|nr:helix-turn-helix transcriptional regulator [Pararhizobium arenae]